MKFGCIVVLITVTLVVAGLPGTIQADAGEKFLARLSWVPVDARDHANVKGKGAATAVLVGTKLSVSGTFQGLAAPATLAQIHNGIAEGVSGLAIADLKLTKRTQGIIAGSIDLTPELVASLKQGKLYLQIHSKKGLPPDGSNLWGWFLK